MSDLFKPPLSPEESYWAGFIHADGCLSFTPRKRLTLVQKDPEVLSKFLLFIEQDSKITARRQTGLGYGTLDNYSITTNKGFDNLVRLGIKAVTCSELRMSRHFWRGMVDGDGSVLLYGNNPSIWLSGKEVDIRAFSVWVGSLFGGTGPTPYNPARGGWYIKVANGRAKALGEYLYKGHYSALPRKSQVALSFDRVPTKSKAKIVEKTCE